ncbi:MAG: FxLYD domain-containing protein, partial [Rhodospirillales bacterium]
GFIQNTTREKIAVPMIKVALYNADNKEVQAVMVTPRTPQVDPGKSLGFRAQIDDPAATARRFEVTFTEAKSAPGTQPSDGEQKQEKAAPKK